jgi:multisubunit Na+/H+ antiporter MnhE subunit
VIPALVQFAVLLGFWLLLSMRLYPMFVGLGAVSAAAVTAFTHRLVSAALRGGGVPWTRLPVAAWRFVAYLAWLFGRMVSASVQMAYFVLHPRMPLDPVVVRKPPSLRSHPARLVRPDLGAFATLALELEVEQVLRRDHFAFHADDLITLQAPLVVRIIPTERLAIIRSCIVDIHEHLSIVEVESGTLKGRVESNTPSGPSFCDVGTELQFEVYAAGQRLEANDYQLDGSSIVVQSRGGAVYISPSPNWRRRCGS